ncbi:MAG: hypothetical protein ACOX3P_03815 [Saccharofermentanales bacterium]|jgi:transcription elongation factor Elf1|nr:hypothetical protein [Clostridiales bacterium]
MKIKRILQQHRRDFRAEYECQFCGHIAIGTGYDDANFHENVIPKMVCDSCGKSVAANKDELTEEYRPLATKYPEGYQI